MNTVETGISDPVEMLGRDLLARNLRRVRVGGQSVDCIVAAPEYRRPFFWDSAFTAIALCHVNPAMAQKQIEVMASRQRNDGFMGIINFCGEMSFLEKLFYWLYYDGRIPLITQPPVLAIAQERVFGATKNVEALRRILPKLAANIDYFTQKRDPDGDSLVSAIHPWELGIDLTPTGDKYLKFSSKRPSFAEAYLKMFLIFAKYKMAKWQEKKILAKNVYHVENVLFNVIVSEASRSVARMYQTLKDQKNYRKYLEIADKIKQAIIDRCWDERTGLFYDLDRENNQIRVKTISSLSPLFLEGLDKKYAEALIKHLRNKKEFWAAYPIPSVAMDEPTFNPTNSRVLWRGQTFVNTNWLIAKGLKKNGYGQLADELEHKTVNMVLGHGPYEFHNCLNGQGGGASNLAWDSLIMDMAH
jgi:glycogen debranching enzyme